MSHLVPIALLAGPPGPGEYLLLLVAVLLLFGPKRLPEIVRSLGRIMAELRRASQDFRDEIMRIEEPHRDAPTPEPDIAAEWTEPEVTEEGDQEQEEDSRDLPG